MDCGTKPESPEETLTGTRSTCKLHSESPHSQDLPAVRRQCHPLHHRTAILDPSSWETRETSSAHCGLNNSRQAKLRNALPSQHNKRCSSTSPRCAHMLYSTLALRTVLRMCQLSSNTIDFFLSFSFFYPRRKSLIGETGGWVYSASAGKM